jgi:hypothetical protein
MKRFLISVVVSVALGVFVLPVVVSTQAKAASKPRVAAMEKLGKTMWWVELKMEGQSPMPDVLAFGKGMFDSYSCHAYGFGRAEYMAAEEGKAVTFTATTKSRRSGAMEWKGKVEGGAISGTMTWQQASGAPKEITFSGMRHKPEGALDASKWKAELMTEGQKPMPDTLAFGRGMFDSKACHKYGFGWGPYNAKKEGENTSFTAFTVSATDGMMMWMGEVKGEAVSGTMTWYPTQGEAKKFTFSGAKEKPRR